MEMDEGADPDVHDDEATENTDTTYAEPEPDEGTEVDQSDLSGTDEVTDDDTEGAEHG